MKIKNSFINILREVTIILLTILCTIMYFKIVSDTYIHTEKIKRYESYIQRLKDVNEDMCKIDY